MCFGTFLGMADRGGTKYVPPRSEEIRPLMGGTAASPAPAAGRAAAVGQRAIGQHSAGVPVPRPNASPLPPSGRGQQISATAQAQLPQATSSYNPHTYPPATGRKSPQADTAPPKTSASQPSSPPKANGTMPRGVIASVPTLSTLLRAEKCAITKDWLSQIELPQQDADTIPRIESADEVVERYQAFSFPYSLIAMKGRADQRSHDSCLIPTVSSTPKWDAGILPFLVLYQTTETVRFESTIGKIASARSLLYMLLSSTNVSDVLRVQVGDGTPVEESPLLESYPSQALFPHLRDLLLTEAPVSTSIQLSGTVWSYISVHTLPNPTNQSRFAFQEKVPPVTVEEEDRPTFSALALQLIDELKLQDLVNRWPSPLEIEIAIKQAVPFVCLTGLPTDESIPLEARPQSLVEAFQSKGAEKFYKFNITGVRYFEAESRADYGMLKPGMSLAQFERLFTFRKTSILPSEVATKVMYGDTVVVACQDDDMVVGIVALPGKYLGEHVMHPMDRFYLSTLSDL